MVLFIKVLFNALDKIPGVAFTFAGDDHDVFGVNNYSFHTLSILDPCFIYRVGLQQKYGSLMGFPCANSVQNGR